jgi:Type II secretion system (T2SS), protein E, N-terminal domain
VTRRSERTTRSPACRNKFGSCAQRWPESKTTRPRSNERRGTSSVWYAGQKWFFSSESEREYRRQVAGGRLPFEALSAELARRLIHSGAATVKVEAALFSAVDRGISLTQAVNELYPDLLELLERALDRGDFPAIHTVRALPDVVRQLPLGMCERLLALPVHRDSRSERIDVAAVDVLDAHVAKEFAFHLRVPVRVLRAPFSELVAALEGLHTAGIFLPGLSRILAADRGNFAASASSASVEIPRRPLPSEPPIPLVRKSLGPARAPWVEDVPRVSLVMPEAEREDNSPEPVLSLGRPKPLPPRAPEPEQAGPPWALEFEAAVAAIEAAASPEQVVSGLCEGLRPVRALVFAVRATSFDVRGGSAVLGSPTELRALSVPSGNGSLLDATARLGYYLGPQSQLAALTPLEGKWGTPAGGECYARTVNVSERPSLILLMAGFRDSTEATRRADVLARTAGSVLENIVRSRKKS